MKTFLILYCDKNLKKYSDDALYQHIDFLKSLHISGKLLTCGPFADNCRAFLIIKCTTLGEVENIIKNDPFIKCGYYNKYSIDEFIEANQGNDWLLDLM